MFTRLLFLCFVALALPAWAQDEWESGTAAQETVEPQASESMEKLIEVHRVNRAPGSRLVPVRYWVSGDSVEQEAVFVKIERDTVFLKKPNKREQRLLAKIEEKKNVALQVSNGQQVEEEEEFDDEIEAPVAEVIMTDAVKDSLNAQTTVVKDSVVEDDGANDDLETALEKESIRLKKAEIAKVEEEIRQREIQDSIAAEAAYPYFKVYRLNLKRLYNLQDDVMIDLMQSNYFVPKIVREKPKVELYPEGTANLLVTSTPEACSLFVNGVPIGLVTPDTIRNIRPGKYTISIMRVLKDAEWWGSAVVRLNADSLNRVAIPVVRPSTRLTLNTDPEAVEVFIDEKPTENILPHYMTDVVIDNLKPQTQTTIYFRKVGYRDTTITTEVKAFMPNLINVELTPVLDDLEFVEAQKAFDAERSQRRLGRGLLWGAIVPIIAGGVLWYLAERDWSDAAEKKKAYGLSAFESKDTRRMVKDNHDLNDRGDLKCGIAIGLGAVGLGMLVTGVIFAF